MHAPASTAIGLGARITLLACSTFTLLVGASISPALPAIQQEFAATPGAELLTKLVLTVAPLFMAVGGLLFGLLIDRWQRRPVLIGAIVATGLIGACGALMDSLAALILVRALLGLAVAGVTTSCYTLISDYLQGAERERFFGLQGAAQKLGGLVFVLLGGVLAAIHWRLTFAVDLIVLLILPLALAAVHEPRRLRPRQGGLHERLPRAVLPWAWLIGAVGQVVFYALPTQLPFLMSETLQAGPKDVGIGLAIGTLASVLISLAFDRIRRALGVHAVFAGVCLLVGTSFWLISQARSVPAVYVAMAVGGLGFGLLMPNLTVWLVEHTPATLRGRAIGLMMMGVFLGQFSSPLWLQPLIASVGRAASFAVVGSACGVAALAFAVLGARQPGRPARALR